MPGSGVFLHPSGLGEQVLVASRSEVVELLAVPAQSVSVLQYGARSVMFMRHQPDCPEAPTNEAAQLTIRKTIGLPLAVRGAVVAFPFGVPWQEG